MTFPISKEQKNYAKMIARQRNDDAFTDNRHTAYDKQSGYVVNCQGALAEVLFADQYTLARPELITYDEAKRMPGDVAGYEIKARVTDYIKHELWINCADVDNVPAKPVVLIKVDKDYETYRYLGWIWSDDIPNVQAVRREINQHGVWVYRVDATSLLPVDILPLPTDGGF
jgi:hypothetical protein